MQHPYSLFRRKSLKTVVIVSASMTAAFIIGIKTAGDVSPVVSPTMADTNVLAGDMNNDGQLTTDDVRIVLEIANGYRTPTASELAADPNLDYSITADDAMAILDTINKSSQAPEVE